MVRRDPTVPMGAIVLLDPTASSPHDSGYVTVAGAVTHHLKLGVNTVGRQRDNDIVVADQRVECAMLPIRDGVTLIRKL